MKHGFVDKQRAKYCYIIKNDLYDLVQMKITNFKPFFGRYISYSISLSLAISKLKYFFTLLMFYLISFQLNTSVIIQLFVCQTNSDQGDIFHSDVYITKENYSKLKNIWVWKSRTFKSFWVVKKTED